jgi:hypothetical protein
MAAKRASKTTNKFLTNALRRAEAMQFEHEIWAHSSERIAVWFPDEQNVYIYAVPKTAEEDRLNWVPGRAILKVDKMDAPLDEFKALVCKLV